MQHIIATQKHIIKFTKDYIENVNGLGENIVRLFDFNKAEAILFRDLLKEMIIEKVPMSIFQYFRYQEVRDIEKKEDSNKFKKGESSEIFSIMEENSSSSSYRIRSRQVSNYLIPDYLILI